MSSWHTQLQGEQCKRSDAILNALVDALIVSVARMVDQYARVRWLVLQPGFLNDGRWSSLWFRDADDQGPDARWHRIQHDQNVMRFVGDESGEVALVLPPVSKAGWDSSWQSIGMLLDHGHPSYHLKSKTDYASRVQLSSSSCIDRDGSIYGLIQSDGFLRVRTRPGVPVFELLRIKGVADFGMVSPPVVCGSQLFWFDHMTGEMHCCDPADPNGDVQEVTKTLYGMAGRLVSVNGCLHNVAVDGLHCSVFNPVSRSWTRYPKFLQPRVGYGIL